jgi:hypothetical protein
MNEIKIGDKVRVKDRPDWPSSPGYRLANAEGVVTKSWQEMDHEAFREYVEVRLNKAQAGVNIKPSYNFRREDLELISRG